jgi:hypothetical protein
LPTIGNRIPGSRCRPFSFRISQSEPTRSEFIHLPAAKPALLLTNNSPRQRNDVIGEVVIENSAGTLWALLLKKRLFSPFPHQSFSVWTASTSKRHGQRPAASNI